jgi:UDP-glucose 4-epimerase
MILLTGASGFIGKHLIEALKNSFGEDNIVALTSSPITNCRFLLHNGYRFNDDFFIKNRFTDIDTIIHAGAFTPKSKSEINSIPNCNSNILSTYKLTTSKLPKLNKLIYLSSIDVYSNEGLITETTPTLPISLYGQSKLYCEKLITTCAIQNSINYQILRLGHVYGPGEEKYNKIIPLTMNRLLKDEIIKIQGEGMELRSYIYIMDVVNSIIESLKPDKFLGVVNIVGSEQIRIKDLISKIISISQKVPIIENEKSTLNPNNIYSDNSKMKRLLITPKVCIDEGLIEEWDYMKKIFL